MYLRENITIIEKAPEKLKITEILGISLNLDIIIEKEEGCKKLRSLKYQNWKQFL